MEDAYRNVQTGRGTRVCSASLVGRVKELVVESVLNVWPGNLGIRSDALGFQQLGDGQHKRIVNFWNRLAGIKDTSVPSLLGRASSSATSRAT